MLHELLVVDERANAFGYFFGVAVGAYDVCEGGKRIAIERIDSSNKWNVP